MPSPIFERGSILETVTNALVGNDFHVNDLLLDDVTFSIQLENSPFCSVRNKNGKVSKIIKVVVDRFDS